ncbi:MAG: cation:proton antiporter [Nitriliruptorales bacterium]|nr:cation:proton antiporter [Nitriliruptorales bacterium]
MILAVEAGGHSGFAVGNLLAVLVVAWGVGRLFERVGYPSILGELLGGIVLGPPMLGLLNSDPALNVIGDLGVILMMLYIGTEIDIRDLRRASVPGLMASIGGFVVPFALGFLLIRLTGGGNIPAMFVGSAVGVTSLATKSRILLDLRILDTRIASVLMAAALLSDTATLIVFAGIIGFVELGEFDLGETALVAGEAGAFFVVALAAGILLLPRIASRIRSQAASTSTAMVFVIGTGLLYAWLAELAGLHAILGAFIAGLFLAPHRLGGRVFGEVNRLLRDVSVGLLAPVFFVTAGFATDLGVFRTDLPLLLGVLAVAFIGKIGGTALFYLPTGYGWREGITVGAAMNGRGAVEIIVAGIGLELGLISAELFTILVFMAIFTTATVPILLTAGVRWLKGRGQLTRSQATRRGIVFGGAGPLPRLIAQQLAPTRPVTLVDANPDRCEDARRLGLQVVRGDVLEAESLDEAGIEEAGVFVALTGNTEVNVLAARLAREEFLVGKVFAALRDTLSEGLLRISERAGASPAFGGPVDVGLWERWMASELTTLHVEPINEDDDVERMRGRWVGPKRGLPLIVRRGEDRLFYDAVDEIEAGDEVVLLTRLSDHAELATGTPPAEATDAPA